MGLLEFLVHIQISPLQCIPNGFINAMSTNNISIIHALMLAAIKHQKHIDVQPKRKVETHTCGIKLTVNHTAVLENNLLNTPTCMVIKLVFTLIEIRRLNSSCGI